MHVLDSFLFNKIPNPLGQQKQKFPKVMAIICMEVSPAVTGAPGGDCRLSCLPPLPLSGVGPNVRQESLSVSAKGTANRSLKGHSKA